MSEYNRQGLAEAQVSSNLTPRDLQRIEIKRGIEALNAKRFAQAEATMREVGAYDLLEKLGKRLLYREPIAANLDRNAIQEVVQQGDFGLEQAHFEPDPSVTLQLGFPQGIGESADVVPYSLILRYGAKMLPQFTEVMPTGLVVSRGLRIDVPVSSNRLPLAGRAVISGVYAMTGNSVLDDEAQRKALASMESASDARARERALKLRLPGGWREISGMDSLQAKIARARQETSPYFDFRTGTSINNLSGASEPTMYMKTMPLEK